MPPVPNENDSVGVKILVSKEPVDIENLLKLNPRIKPHANAVPSAVMVPSLRARANPFACAYSTA